MSTNPPPEPTDLSLKLNNGPPPAKRNLPSDNKNNTTNNDINSSQKDNSSVYANSKSKKTKMDLLMAKNPENEENNDNAMQRTIKIATAAVIVNTRITTPVTLQILPNKGSSNVNVAVAHRNIFSAMKIKDPTLKIITPQNDIIDTLLKLRHCSTERMIDDYFTKPLQGSLFRKTRDIIMEVTSFPVDERVEIRDEKSTEKNVRQTSSDKRNNFVAMVISVRPTTTITKERI